MLRANKNLDNFKKDLVANQEKTLNNKWSQVEKTQTFKTLQKRMNKIWNEWTPTRRSKHSKLLIEWFSGEDKHARELPFTPDELLVLFKRADMGNEDALADIEKLYEDILRHSVFQSELDEEITE